MQNIHGFSKEEGGARQGWWEVALRDPRYLRGEGGLGMLDLGSPGLSSNQTTLWHYGLLTLCDGMGASRKRGCTRVAKTKEKTVKCDCCGVRLPAPVPLEE